MEAVEGKSWKVLFEISKPGLAGKGRGKGRPARKDRRRRQNKRKKEKKAGAIFNTPMEEEEEEKKYPCMKIQREGKKWVYQPIHSIVAIPSRGKGGGGRRPAKIGNRKGGEARTNRCVSL